MVDPIVKINMDKKFFDKTESRQAEAGDPGNQGTRDYEDPGTRSPLPSRRGTRTSHRYKSCSSAAAEACWRAR